MWLNGFVGENSRVGAETGNLAGSVKWRVGNIETLFSVVQAGGVALK